jgi:PAS domain S-box-containing protein
MKWTLIMHPWQYTPFVFPLLISTALSVWLALYSWKHRPTAGALPLATLMLGVSIWSFGEAARLVSTVPSTSFIWTRVRYLGIVLVPGAWLAFALEYTGQEKWLTARNIALMAVEPAVMLVLVWTNESHHLIWNEIGMVSRGPLSVWHAPHGVLFWVHAVYSYLLLLIGMFLLTRAFIHLPRLYFAQVGILVIGVILSVVANVLSLVGLNPLPLDPTPLAFALGGLALVWDVLRFRLFGIVPVARSTVVDSMSDGMLVLDPENRVVDINPAARDIINHPTSEIVGRPIDQVLANRPDLIEHFRNGKERHAEITVEEDGSRRYYDLHISPLQDQRGRFGGRLIVLHDISEIKRAEADLISQKQWFESLVAMARATSKLPSLEATLQSAINMAATLTGAEHGSMFLLDGTGAMTHSVLARGETSDEQRESIVQDVMGGGLAGWVVRHRQPALIYDTDHDDRWMVLADTPEAGSAMAIPIVSGSAVLGVLTLTHSKANHFTTDHAYLIQAAADQMTLALRNAQMYDEQRRLADRQTTLYETLRTVGEHLDRESIARAAVDAVARLTHWSGVAILLPDDSLTHLTVQAGAGALSVSEGRHIPLDQGVAGQAFRTVQVQHVPDVKANPDYVYDNPVLCTELAVPLRRGERVLGVLDVASDCLGTFNDEEIRLARSLGEAIALALDNARLYDEIRRYAADLSALYTVARAISRSLVLEDVLAETLDSALASLHFDAGIVSLTHPSNGRLYLAAERGLPPAVSERLRQEGLERTLCAYVYELGEAVAVGDIEQETPGVTKLELDLPLAISEMRTLEMRAYSGIPLRHQERLLGTLSLFARDPIVLSAEDRGLQMAIGQQIATAVTNARLFQAVAGQRSRLQALIASSRDGIILMGMDQRILVINAPALLFLDLIGQPEDWVNRPIQDVLTVLRHYAPGAVQAIRDGIRRVRTGDESPAENECEVPPRTIRWLNLPVTANTTPLGRLLVLRDVTEQRMLERMREDLVHAMVHDLRNPLTVISGALAFLEEDVVGVLPPSHFELWEIAQKSTKSMLELVKAILEISRLESRQMPLEHTLISLSGLVGTILGSQSPLTAEKGLRLESDVPSTLPPAWADEALLRRVLENLIGNAIKFTPSGGVIRVSAEVTPSERPRLLVRVSDTGSGIPPDLQERLFQKFVTGRREGHGSGLGLAFCKMAVESHGERIWVESTGENGTTFALTLPLPPALEL